MGEDLAIRREEIETLRLGLDHGASLIDTAEMYGEGSAEKLVGKAMEGRRDAVFLVDKVLPQNAPRRGMLQAYDGSLLRLGKIGSTSIFSTGAAISRCTKRWKPSRRCSGTARSLRGDETIFDSLHPLHTLGVNDLRFT